MAVGRPSTEGVILEKRKAPLAGGGLRKRAERLLRLSARDIGQPAESAAMLALMHELQVYQVELEMQNEELHRAKDDMEAALRQISDLYDFAPVAYFTLGDDARIHHANLAGAALLGMPRAELAALRLDAFVAPRSLAAFRSFHQHAMLPRAADAAKTQCELILTARDGTNHAVLAEGVCAEPARECRVTLTDITERKSADEQLRLAALVYQAIGEAIMVADADDRIVAVNPAFTALTGYSEKEATDHTTALLKSGRHDPLFYQEMWHALNTTGRWQGEIQNRRKNGEIYAEWLMISTIYDDNGAVLQRVAMFSDITDKKRVEATIWRQANYDPLTNLPNRNLFRDRLEQELKNVRGAGDTLALMFIDLDNFKEVNDTLGHSHGDQLLVEAAKRIGACVREGDTVARLGGDEFTIILSKLDDAVRIEQVAQLILREIARPYVLSGDLVHISASIGITLYPGDATDIETLLKNADRAMYEAKALGRSRYSYFTAAMQHAALARLQLSNDLRGALAAGQLSVHYQPIIHLASKRCVKAEALLRWRHPTRGMVGPAEFIPLAEQIGIIPEIGDWVFREAAEQVKRWIEMDAHCVQVSVNKSPRQFVEGKTHLDWLAHLRAIDLSAACINVEITEGLLLDERLEVTENLLLLRNDGIQVSLDDFGTGYSAMSYLKKFPIDYLKIDKSFVRDMVTDPTDQAIVEAIIAMAHRLGMKVIAEGVETLEQRDMLVGAGCDFAQGYLFARPMPHEAFSAYLRKGEIFA